MSFFNRKKGSDAMTAETKEKEENDRKMAILKTGYTTWNEDFGFIILLMSEELKNQTKYVLETLSKQYAQNNNSYTQVTDKDIRAIFTDMLTSVMTKLSPNYVDFLCTKYFRSIDSLSQWIGEYLYDGIVDATIHINNKQISDEYSKKMSDRVYSMNTIPVSEIANKVKQEVLRDTAIASKSEPKK